MIEAMSSCGSSTSSRAPARSRRWSATRRASPMTTAPGRSRSRDPREQRRRLAAYTALSRPARARGRPRRARPAARCALRAASRGSARRRRLQPVPHGGAGADRRDRGAGSIGVDLERTRPVKMSPRRSAEIIALGAGLGDTPPAGTSAPTAPSCRRGRAWRPSARPADGDWRARSPISGSAGRGGCGLPPARLEAAARRLASDAGFSVRDLGLPPGLHGALAAPRGAARAPARVPVRPPRNRAAAGAPRVARWASDRPSRPPQPRHRPSRRWRAALAARSAAG